MRRPSPRFRSALLGAAGFTLAFLFLETPVGAQFFDVPGRAQTLGGDPSSSLARYVPKDNLIIYLEYDGLDAHADAWRKTAAYKILNNTTTGVMLEDLFVQLFGKIPGAKVSGPEALAVLKHVARSGFVFAAGGDFQQPKPDYILFAFRDAYKNKDVRPVFARSIQGLMTAPNAKPQAVVRAGHKVISAINPGGGTSTWWVEDSKKEDLVVVTPTPEAADVILETLDGKRANAIGHPSRAELARPEGGFVATGLFYLNPAVFQGQRTPEALGLSGITKFDFRWGFHDESLVNIARINSPSPRKGVLALLDGPTFTKKSLPPLPESLDGFTTMSMDLKSSMDRIIALARMARPDAEDQVNQAIDAIKAKTKLRLREDILSHVGPKVAWYVLPGKAAAAPSTPAAPNAMSLFLSQAGLGQIPRLAIVLDIDSAAAFGKVLDELMVYANRELKSQTPGGAGAGAEGGAARGNRNRAPSGPTLEFRLGTGDVKSYTLNVPPELAAAFPPTLRPTVRVGPKNVVIAVSPDVARLALEAKGAWTPPNELAGAFLGLSDKLRYLSVDDPRDTTPAALAALPAKLQLAINSAILKAQASAATPTPTPGAAAPAPAPAGSEPGGPGPRGRSRGIEAPGPQGIGGSDSAPRGIPPAGQPGTAGQPGAPGQDGSAGRVPTIVLQVDAAKLPSADAIKGMLFPSVTSAEVTDEGLRIVVRQAFPAMGDPAFWGGFAGGFSAASARAREAARGNLAVPQPKVAPPRTSPEPGKGASPGGGASSSSN